MMSETNSRAGKSMFDRAFVINLPFKVDRLERFQASYPSCLPTAEVWQAVHGDSVRHPDWWTAGSGAWGCYRSHMQILEYCYQRGIESYIVFEDDAIFRPDFEEQVKLFMGNLPPDWEQLYLGGQLLHEVQHPPRKVADNVYFPRNVNRTHCFAVHRRGYERLYKHLNAVPFQQGEHIDHHLGRLHDTGTLKVYVPGKWLVGQDGGPSNISGKNNSATYWIDPERIAIENRTWSTRPVPTVFLDAPIEVAIELERRGWHRGHWQNEQRLDRGVCNAISSLDLKGGLLQWQKMVVPEAVREGKSCVCLYHPSLMWQCVESVGFEKITRIVASDVDDAERQLAAIDAPEPGATPKRNLIYHIWPRKGNGVWQWNVEQLLKRIEQFDGVRSIGVATSPDADALVDVQRAFDGVRIDNWIEFPNNPDMGEAQTFVKLLDTLPIGDGSITFRGHAKGVKYDNPHEHREWTEMLYEICLDDPEHVSATLEQFPVAGPFCVDNRWPGGNKFGWYYSGGFYWFTADILKKPDAKQIREDYWGAELWPGQHYDRNDIGILFGQNCGHLYNASEVERMKEWLAKWRLQRRSGAAKRPAISVIVPTLGRQSLVGLIDAILRQLSDLDELILVADGDEALARTKECLELQMRSHSRTRVVSHTDPLSQYGNAQRNHGMSIATGDLLWFVDDDDIVLAGAVSAIREGIHDGNAPMMFRIRHCGRTIWERQEIAPSNTSGQQLVVPNKPDTPRFPVPAENPEESDQEWIRAVNEKWPVQWNESVIYEIRSHSKGVL